MDTSKDNHQRPKTDAPVARGVCFLWYHTAMHIVINGWFWNQPHTGSGQYLRHLIEYLPRVAPELRLTLVVPVSYASRTLPHSPCPPGLSAWTGLHPVPCTSSNIDKVWFEQIAFPRVCRELGADVAHVPYWGGPLQPSVPTVVSILDLIPMLLPEYRGGPLVRLYTSLVAAAAHNAAHIITLSKASKRDIVNHLHIAADKVHAIYLAADERFAPRARLETPSLKNSLPENYVLYLGGFDIRKNIDTLLQMCVWLQKAFGADIPLVIAGQLPERHDRFFRDPRIIARQLGVAEMVRCIGAVAEKDKPELYRRAQAFVYPSRYEGFGLPALEALACGVPVIGSNAASIPEIVGDAGMLVDSDDAERMGRALIAVLNDAQLHADLTHKAAAQAAHFSWETCARQTTLVYAAALE
jgi:glycosyltransferase involved in cell wall biosynthesis